MSVFTETCFLFLRDPRGGVEDLDRMLAAGFGAVFCNIGDHAPAEWEKVIRPRAQALGMPCGPWLRTTDNSNVFLPSKLTELVACADRWGSPLIVNSEAELKGTDDQWTTLIADTVAGRDAALSMEPQPFADVAWWPLRDVPVLPQVFGLGDDLAWFVDQWHAYGVRCVFPTFGTYSGWTPADYDLTAPYSLYTADDCGGNFAAWSPRAYGFQGCVDDVPDGGGNGGDALMQAIGTQHGVDAAIDRLIKLDPGGSKPNRNPDDLATWGAYDKLRRSLTILVADHDEQLKAAGDDA